MLIGNPMCFVGYPPEEALVRMRDLGIDGVELCAPTLESCKTPDMLRRFAAYIESLGMSLVRYNVAGAAYFGPLEPGDDWRDILTGLKRDIDRARAMGVSQLMTWEGRPPKQATKEDIHGWCFDVSERLFGEALDHAGSVDVEITIEVHPFTYGIDLDWMLRLCDALDSPRFSVTYDSCHFAVGLPGNGYLDAIQTLGERIGHVHLTDSDQVSSEVHFPIGHGCLDMDGIVSKLKAIGFKGTMMLDTWLYPLPVEATRVGVPFARRAMRELGIA